jgi:glycosyltransferase involved in cell wall biosynthesis
MVHHDIDALLAPPDDPDALAQAVLRILREPGLAERLSRAAIANAQRFTWPVLQPQLAAVYGMALGRLVDW